MFTLEERKHAIRSGLLKARHQKSSFTDPEDSWAFADAFTLDPNEVGYAWKCLSTDTVTFELGQLPKTLHTALVETLTEARAKRIEVKVDDGREGYRKRQR